MRDYELDSFDFRFDADGEDTSPSDLLLRIILQYVRLEDNVLFDFSIFLHERLYFFSKIQNFENFASESQNVVSKLIHMYSIIVSTSILHEI